MRQWKKDLVSEVKTKEDRSRQRERKLGKKKVGERKKLGGDLRLYTAPRSPLRENFEDQTIRRSHPLRLRSILNLFQIEISALLRPTTPRSPLNGSSSVRHNATTSSIPVSIPSERGKAAAVNYLTSLSNFRGPDYQKSHPLRPRSILNLF